MSGISAEKIVGTLKQLDVRFVVTLPDSRLFEVQKAVKADQYFTVIEVQNEGEGIAICCGLFMGGKKCIMLMEDTGIYEGASALEKFGNQNEMPVVMLVGYHKPFGEGNWFQVTRTTITGPLLDVLRVPHAEVSSDEIIDQIFKDAYITAYSSQQPVAILCSVHVK